MSYDSDSSLEDLDGYTETSVILGYTSSKQSIDTLGGIPTWLDEKTTPSASLAKCKICNDFMSLLLQLNGDLPEKFAGHERRLYVYSCRRKTCRRKEGAIRGFRGVRSTKSQAKTPDSSTKSEKPRTTAPADFGNQLFGGTSARSPNANPFAANPFSPSAQSTNTNPFSSSSLAAKPAQRPDDEATLPETFASKARISEISSSSDPAFIAPKKAEPPEPWPSADKFPKPYPQYYLDAESETLDKPKEEELPRVTGSMDDTEMGGTSSSSGGVEDKQLYESAMDKTFQHFADRLAQNPEQVLRYEFGGQPLLYSSTDAVGTRLTSQTKGFPRCTSCGSERVFELQLTPHAIAELEAQELGLDGMDWGTIVMGVCSKDCVPSGVAEKEVGYVEEWIGVQWEELLEKRK